jgi:putative tryptophan/tyrosine transport system substrate-binding protein
MRRRDFIVGVGGAAAWSLAACAQQPGRVWRLAAFINLQEGDPEAQRSFAALRQGLAALGSIGGRNVGIDYRWATDDPNSIRSSASELVGLAPDVILASATDGLAAFQHETRAITIVFVAVSDRARPARPLRPTLVPRGKAPRFHALGWSTADDRRASRTSSNSKRCDYGGMP